MSDFSPEALDSLRLLVSHRGWSEYVVPSLLSIREACVREILDPTADRRARTSDDYLRGTVHALDTLLALRDRVADMAATAQEMPPETTSGYESRAALGLFGAHP